MGYSAILFRDRRFMGLVRLDPKCRASQRRGPGLQLRTSKRCLGVSAHLPSPTKFGSCGAVVGHNSLLAYRFRSAHTGAKGPCDWPLWAVATLEMPGTWAVGPCARRTRRRKAIDRPM